jgi:hypothetical protein
MVAEAHVLPMTHDNALPTLIPAAASGAAWGRAQTAVYLRCWVLRAPSIMSSNIGKQGDGTDEPVSDQTS